MIDLGGKKLILASKSPRRFELLKGLGLDFEVRTKETEENYPSNLPLSDVAGYLSELKAKAFQDEMKEDEIILTSDTVVIHNDEFLGKPLDKNVAKEMLRKLSGNDHLVITGISFLSKEKCITKQDFTKVYFKELSDQEIDYYIDQYQPFDKAGAYGIQEWIGYVGVQKIEGSYFTVMGLPVHLVYEVLTQW
ncbi:Maf family nucleotide pyrophosphatase [Shivajiella indica]|uniref:dTTP/UTP pyrophosphatase n=1 Tax=Shivajiella indica TaxID=872115 RepID=A0ABW5BBR5_9BACT